MKAKNHYHREQTVATALALLQQEVDHIEEAMEAADEPPDPTLYRPALKRAREIFSVALLPQAWSPNVTPKLTTEVIQAIGWCAREMPHDEAMLTEEQVTEFLDQIRDLIRLFEGSEMRPALKNFILQQLRLIEQAIINYAVVGARPIVDAFVRVRREISERQPEIAAETASSESHRALWEKLQRYGEKLYMVLSGLVKFSKQLKEGYDNIRGLLPSSTPGGKPGE